jgi:DNA-binding IclR family transcriptional regulator
LKTTSDRVLSVLALFTHEKSEWTVEEAAELLKLPISTAYRYFKSLANAELIIAYWPGRYVLGPAVIEFDRLMRLSDPLINASKSVMQELADSVGECVAMLARCYMDKVMCVHRENARGSMFDAIGYERGRPMPIDRGAASKVILANLNSRQRRAITVPEGNPNLKTELKAIRSHGFSITEGEVTPGIMGAAVPIFRSDQTLEGSLGLILPGDRKANQQEVVEALIRARKQIESNLAIEEAQRHKFA